MVEKEFEISTGTPEEIAPPPATVAPSEIDKKAAKKVEPEKPKPRTWFKQKNIIWVKDINRTVELTDRKGKPYKVHRYQALYRGKTYRKNIDEATVFSLDSAVEPNHTPNTGA